MRADTPREPIGVAVVLDLDGLGYPEVNELDVAVLIYEDILKLDIEVGDGVSVKKFQSLH